MNHSPINNLPTCCALQIIHSAILAQRTRQRGQKVSDKQLLCNLLLPQYGRPWHTVEWTSQGTEPHCPSTACRSAAKRFYHALSGSVRICRAQSGFVGLCQALSNSVGPCQVLSGFVGPCQALWGSVGLFRTVRPCWTLSGPVRLCWALSSPFGPCQALLRPVRLCRALSGSVRQEFTLSPHLTWRAK